MVDERGHRTSGWRRLRVSGVLALALMGVWALAGCVALPSSGSVHPGPSQVRQDSLDLDLLAAGPQPGATQSQILQGFIDAATDPQNGYQVARAFLTTDEAARWRPGAGATLDQSVQRRTTTTAPTTMQVTVAPVASVGAAGDYAQLASPSPITLTYQFAKVGNEWRIAGAPPGVLIDEQNFPRVFRSHTLYFFDPSFTYAVPDVRWFAGRDSVQTSIVRALVAGPVGWLQGAVLTGFPTGARLDPDAVPLDGTTAVVALSSPTVTAEAEARMVFQLSASLGDVPTIASVRLLLNGTPQDVKPTSVRVSGTVPANDTVYTANGFVTLRATDATGIPVPGLTAQLGGIVPTAAAGDGSNFVFAARGVLYRARPSGAPAELGPALTVPPVTDRFGYAWVADASTIIGYPPNGPPVSFPSPWAGSTVTAVAVSPDGARLAALVTISGTAQAQSVSIMRDGSGALKGLGNTVARVTSLTGSARDLAFLDPKTLVALTVTGSGSQIVTATIGGTTQREDGPAAAEQLDPSTGVGQIRVLSTDGTLNVLSGAGWQHRAAEVVFLVRSTAR